MANFRTHASFGAAFGLVFAGALVALALFRDAGVLVSVFLIFLIGAILPDIDSDSGVPFHVTFGTLSLVSGIALCIELARHGLVWWENLAWSTGLAVFVWIAIGYLFKRFTRHRGMAHSLPAALLFGLGVFSFASRFSFSDMQSFLLALAAFFGYLLHLILDEMNSVVDFEGKSFTPKKSLGSAIKLFSHSRAINISIYGAIGFLLAGNVSRLHDLAMEVWGIIGT